MVAVHLEHVVTICTIILFAARPRLGLREWAMEFVVKLEILRRRSSPPLSPVRPVHSPPPYMTAYTGNAAKDLCRSISSSSSWEGEDLKDETAPRFSRLASLPSQDRTRTHLEIMSYRILR